MKRKVYGRTSYLVSAMTTSPYIRLYQRDTVVSGQYETDIFTKLDFTDLAPGVVVFGVNFSDDGKYLALGCWSSTEPLRVYKRNLNRFTKLTVPAPLGSISGTYRIDFTPDGRYIAITNYSTTSYVNWYRIDGDVITRLPTPMYGMPGGTGTVQWDPSGRYVAFGKITANGGYMGWYRRDGDTLVKLPNPSVMPTSEPDSVIWSPDGNYLGLSIRQAEQFILYRRAGDTLVKVSDNIPNGAIAYNAAFSPDGKHLAVSYNAAPWLTIYRIDGETFTPLSSALVGGDPGSGSLCLEYSNDGKYLTVAGYWSQPGLTVYKIDSETYTKQVLGTPATYTSRAVAMWTDFVEVSKSTLTFAKVAELPAQLEPNAMYMVPGSGDSDLKIYLSDMNGEEVRHVVASDELTAMVATATATLNEVAVVSDIAARDALGLTSGKTVLVLDASADVTVTSGSATYQYVVSTDSYHKLSERESMDLLLTWDSLVDGVLSSAVDVDDAVALRHTHYDLSALDQITVVSNQLFFAGTALVSSIEVAEW